MLDFLEDLDFGLGKENTAFGFFGGKRSWMYMLLTCEAFLVTELFLNEEVELIGGKDLWLNIFFLEEDEDDDELFLMEEVELVGGKDSRLETFLEEEEEEVVVVVAVALSAEDKLEMEMLSIGDVVGVGPD